MAFEVSIDKSARYPVIILKDSQTGCEAEIYSFGGLLNAYRLPTASGIVNVVEGFASVADAEKNITDGFKSAKLNPFVCRLHKGSYSFQDKQYKVNSFYIGDHAIHGLTYRAVFEVLNVSTDISHAGVQLQYRYNGSDAGYPFPFTLTVEWKLQAGEQGNTLSATTAVLNNHTTAIPLIDGWHPYFTLGTALDECSLQFNTDLQVEFNGDLLPTGNTIPDARFVKGLSMNGIELDNCFLLDPSREQSRCILQNNLLRLTIEPDASYPYLQIYTPPHRKSIAIENLTGAPDAFNNGIGLIVLPGAEERSFTTSYSIADRRSQI